MADGPRYDVCVSFARDQRDYVRGVYEALVARGVECFFDEPQQVDLWGQDLAQRFDQVFRKEAQFCIAFVTREWVDRTWPAHERRSALARMLEEPGYLLPVRFDETEVPGLSPTIGYLDGNLLDPDELADLITKKVRRRPAFSYLPPFPNRLFAALQIDPEDKEGQLRVLTQAEVFLSALEGLNEDEREFALAVFGLGCTCNLPAGAHLPLEHLARRLEWNGEQAQRVIRGLNRVPGFVLNVVQEPVAAGEETTLGLELGWEARTAGTPPGMATDIASAMVREAGYQACGDCYTSALERLDFSRTSTLLDWNGEDFELLDSRAAPFALRDLVDELLEMGWIMEATPEQIRFLAPGNDLFDVVPLADPFDERCLEQAREGLEALLFDAYQGG